MDVDLTLKDESAKIDDASNDSTKNGVECKKEKKETAKLLETVAEWLTCYIQVLLPPAILQRGCLRRRLRLRFGRRLDLPRR